MSVPGKNTVRILAFGLATVATLAPERFPILPFPTLVRAVAQEAASSQTYIDELYARARRSLDSKPRDPAAAAALLDQATRAGDGRSMLALAELYLLGDGVAKDPARAERLMQEAIGSGLARQGWAAIATLHAQDGPIAAPALELEALRHAAELGDQKSMISLAERLSSDSGGSVDFDGAKSWLSKAIAVGGDVARPWSKLGDLYLNAAPPHRNAASAADAYQRAIDLGDTWSLIALGRLLGRGDGLPADVDRANVLLDRAVALKGDVATAAWVVQGQIYADPSKSWYDPVKAVGAFQKAADAGDPWSMVSLARFLGRGDGVPADFPRARKYLERATGLDKDAATAAWATLGQLYGDTTTPWHDPARAAEAYQHAADAGDPWSLVSLGRMLGRGEGIPVDFTRAQALLDQATTIGGTASASAWATLGQLYGDASRHWHDPAKAAEAYDHAAALGDTASMVALGKLLGRGEGAPEDFQKARALFERAIAGGDSAAASAWSSLAQLYADTGKSWHDAGKALDAYQHAAELADTWAMAAAGRMLATGAGVLADFDKGKILLDRAIEASDGSAASAWGALGQAYNVRNAPQYDPTKAADAYRRSADLGDPWSMAALGRMLARGEGVPPDVEAAKALLNAATKGGDGPAAAALTTLGQLYGERDKPWYDPTKAVEAYRQAAGLGAPWAMVSYGRMLGLGEGVPANINQARTMLEQAIATDSSVAAAAWGALGQIYSRGEPLRRNPTQAAEAYRQAADLGDSWSMIALGQMLASGDGVGVDFERARTLFESAAENSDTTGDAWAGLGDLYRKADAGNQDLAKALAYYEQAAAKGSARSHLDIADLTRSNAETSDQIASLLAHYRQAVAGLGTEPVAKAMFLLNPTRLRVMVQLLLNDAGRTVGPTDGIFGPRTLRAIDQFCASNLRRSCSGGTVTLDLLSALLMADNAKVDASIPDAVTASGAKGPARKSN